MRHRLSIIFLPLGLALCLHLLTLDSPVISAQPAAQCRDITFESLGGSVPAVLCIPLGAATVRPGIVYLHGSDGPEHVPAYGGIGAQLDANPLRIGTPFPASPAEAAGLMAGDEIIAIDGFPAAELTVEEAIPLIRGEEGSAVHLTIAHPELPETEELAVVRAVIAAPPNDLIPMPIRLPRDLAAQGFVTIAVNYFALTPSPGPNPGSFVDAPPQAYVDGLPIWLQIVSDGVSVLQSRPEVDPNRIGVVGWSGGAQVGLRSALQDHRYHAVVEMSVGANNLPPVDDAIRASTARLPPVLILHGYADETNPVTNAFALRDAMEATGRQHELEVYEAGDHYWRGQQGRDGFDRILVFLRQTLERN